jgi:hypothetical protein
MAQTKKTFRIGEYCKGGILTVEITGKLIVIKALDWNSKKQISVGTMTADERQAQWKIDNYLNDLTSSYYASKVMDWIKTKVQFTYIF